jgi:hypothetical protein
MADVWLAKDCTLKIVDADNIYIDSTTILNTEFTNATGGATSFHAYAKDVTLQNLRALLTRLTWLVLTAIRSRMLC